MYNQIKFSTAYQNQQIYYTNICSIIFEEKRREVAENEVQKMKKFGKKTKKTYQIYINRKILPLCLSLCCIIIIIQENSSFNTYQTINIYI